MPLLRVRGSIPFDLILCEQAGIACGESHLPAAPVFHSTFRVKFKGLFVLTSRAFIGFTGPFLSMSSHFHLRSAVVCKHVAVSRWVKGQHYCVNSPARRYYIKSRTTVCSSFPRKSFAYNLNQNTCRHTSMQMGHTVQKRLSSYAQILSNSQNSLGHNITY